MTDAATSHTPEVLFVCIHNAGRSQMAAALLERHAAGRVVVRSAGSDPGDDLNPAVVDAMAEIGIDLRAAGARPKLLTDAAVEASDVVITMGCGDDLSLLPRPPLPRLGARRSRRDCPSRRCGRSATRSTDASPPCWPIWPRPTRRPSRGADPDTPGPGLGSPVVCRSTRPTPA